MRIAFDDSDKSILSDGYLGIQVNPIAITVKMTCNSEDSDEVGEGDRGELFVTE